MSYLYPTPTDLSSLYNTEDEMAHKPRKPEGPPPWGNPKCTCRECLKGRYVVSDSGRIFMEIPWKERALKAERDLKIRAGFVLLLAFALAGLAWWLI